MVQWLLSLPRTLFVTLTLVVITLFVILQDPPHTICRTQVEHFKSRQKGLIYKDPEVKTRKKPLMDILIQECRKKSSPGSCYQMFAKARRLVNDFNIVSVECTKGLGQVSQVRKVLFQVYDLMIRLAWQKPSSHEVPVKLNWLTEADVDLFCRLKQISEDLYGPATLSQWEQKVFKKLPDTNTLSEDQIRDRSLVSENCVIL